MVKFVSSINRMRADTLASMPMTSTDYVRRDCLSAMRKNPKNRQIFTESALDPAVYRLFKEAFRGGNTPANAARANKIIKGPVYSYDQVLTGGRPPDKQ